MLTQVQDYINRTGQEEADITAGYSFFGVDRVLELIEQANKDNMKLIFYYATDQDQMMDKLSYKFE